VSEEARYGRQDEAEEAAHTTSVIKHHKLALNSVVPYIYRAYSARESRINHAWSSAANLECRFTPSRVKLS